MLGHPLVDALVAAAHQGELLEPRPPVECLLLEWLASRGQQHPVAGLEWIESVGERLDHHHHPGSTAERCVVDLTMGPLAMVAKIVEDDLEQAVCLGPAYQAGRQRRGEVLGEDGDDVDPHRR